MTNASKTAILEAAAKTLAWEIHAATGYGRVRASMNVERFERELSSAARQWRATNRNLKSERRKNDGKGEN